MNKITIKDTFKELFKVIIEDDVVESCDICNNDDNWNLLNSLLIADNNNELVKSKIYKKYLDSKVNISDVETVESFELSDYSLLFSASGGYQRIKVFFKNNTEKLTISKSEDFKGSVLQIGDYILITVNPNTGLTDIKQHFDASYGNITQRVDITISADKTIEIE